MRRFLIFMLVLWWCPVLAAEPEPPYRQALPGYTYQFPRDFFAHEEFQIEWWYYTGHLADADGRSFGYQLTFFRVGLANDSEKINPSKWRVGQIYFAHLTVSDLADQKFYFFERINRKGLGLAGADKDRLHVWNEDWTLTANNRVHHLKAQQAGVGLDLQLQPLKKLVIHGQNGVSQKGGQPGNASHYISHTRMQTRGTLYLKGKKYEVTGTSWMDHEFSSNQLNSEQVGWDWFSVQLDNGAEIMLYLIRLKDGSVEPYSSGSLVRADGSQEHLALREFSIEPTGEWTSPHTDTVYPAGWIMTLPGSKTRLIISPDMPDQELHHLRSIGTSYWEGSVSVQGTQEGQPVTGKGYVELVGYTKPLTQSLPGN